MSPSGLGWLTSSTGSRSVFKHPELRVAAINVSERDAAKIGALPVLGDARTCLEQLAEALAGDVRDTPTWRTTVTDAKKSWCEVRDAALDRDAHRPDRTGVTRGEVIQVLEEESAEGDVLVVAAGGPPEDVMKLWDRTTGADLHIEFGFSCMGYEIPAAIGCRLARPQGEVRALVGDGTYVMAPSELVTAVQEGIKVTIVIQENHGFQAIHRLEESAVGTAHLNEFRSRSGVLGDGALDGDYLSLDLAATARGFGAFSATADTADELRGRAASSSRSRRRLSHRGGRRSQVRDTRLRCLVGCCAGRAVRLRRRYGSRAPDTKPDDNRSGGSDERRSESSRITMSGRDICRG